MWELAREERDNLSMSNYNMYIREGNVEDSIEIFGYHRFYVISYERIMSNFRISKVPRFTHVVNVD